MTNTCRQREWLPTTALFSGENIFTHLPKELDDWTGVTGIQPTNADCQNDEWNGLMKHLSHTLQIVQAKGLGRIWTTGCVKLGAHPLARYHF